MHRARLQRSRPFGPGPRLSVLPPQHCALRAPTPGPAGPGHDRYRLRRQAAPCAPRSTPGPGSDRYALAVAVAGQRQRRGGINPAAWSPPRRRPAGRGAPRPPLLHRCRRPLRSIEVLRGRAAACTARRPWIRRGRAQPTAGQLDAGSIEARWPAARAPTSRARPARCSCSAAGLEGNSAIAAPATSRPGAGRPRCRAQIRRRAAPAIPSPRARGHRSGRACPVVATGCARRRPAGACAPAEMLSRSPPIARAVHAPHAPGSGIRRCCWRFAPLDRSAWPVGSAAVDGAQRPACLAGLFPYRNRNRLRRTAALSSCAAGPGRGTGALRHTGRSEATIHRGSNCHDEHRNTPRFLATARATATAKTGSRSSQSSHDQRRQVQRAGGIAGCHH